MQVRQAHDNMRKQRLNEFMGGFNTISLKLKEMYQMITLGGDAELELVDSLDPFSEVSAGAITRHLILSQRMQACSHSAALEHTDRQACGTSTLSPLLMGMERHPALLDGRLMACRAGLGDVLGCSKYDLLQSFCVPASVVIMEPTDKPVVGQRRYGNQICDILRASVWLQGIVFSVRPPKKSWKNISNLSGGEKTLASLALVFALHHYKPTPLYVMDEIDAALGEGPLTQNDMMNIACDTTCTTATWPAAIPAHKL